MEVWYRVRDGRDTCNKMGAVYGATFIGTLHQVVTGITTTILDFVSTRKQASLCLLIRSSAGVLAPIICVASRTYYCRVFDSLVSFESSLLAKDIPNIFRPSPFLPRDHHYVSLVSLHDLHVSLKKPLYPNVISESLVPHKLVDSYPSFVELEHLRKSRTS